MVIQCLGETTGFSNLYLIGFECHMTAPEIRLALTVGFDPRGYFLGGFNLFKLVNEKLFEFLICII